MAKQVARAMLQVFLLCNLKKIVSESRKWFKNKKLNSVARAIRKNHACNCETSNSIFKLHVKLYNNRKINLRTKSRLLKFQLIRYCSCSSPSLVVRVLPWMEARWIFHRDKVDVPRCRFPNVVRFFWRIPPSEQALRHQCVFCCKGNSCKRAKSWIKMNKVVSF